MFICASLSRYESKNKQSHPVHRGVTPTSPLSSEACRLLKEFQLRYGIGLLFCKISYLDYLVKYVIKSRSKLTNKPLVQQSFSQIHGLMAVPPNTSYSPFAVEDCDFIVNNKCSYTRVMHDWHFTHISEHRSLF